MLATTAMAPPYTPAQRRISRLELDPSTPSSNDPDCISEPTRDRPTSRTTVMRPTKPGMTANVRMGTRTATAIAAARWSSAEGPLGGFAGSCAASREVACVAVAVRGREKDDERTLELSVGLGRYESGWRPGMGMGVRASSLRFWK